MAEIKSTLDLVMERTRHLSQTAEEKTEQQRADFNKRLQGMLQQYADSAVSIDDLRERIAGLQTQLDQPDQKLVLRALLNRVDPEQGNDHWLDLMADLYQAAGDLLEKALATHRERQAGLIQAGEQRQRDRLAQIQGIKGSAVVPNLQTDTPYQEELAALRLGTQLQIEAILQQV